MADEWQTVPFERLLGEPVRNGIYKPKQFHGRGAKIVNMGELFAYPRLRAVAMKRVELSSSESERFMLSRGDLLFARRSLVAEGAGKCSIVLEIDEPTTFESSIIRARPNSAKAEPLYLYYFFNSIAGLHSLDTIRRQVAVAGITGSDLSRLEIPVPGIPEQRAIAHILGTLDDKIELNWRMNEMLETMARALFKSWFVDFDPIRAKAEGRDSGLPQPLGDLFPDSFEDSEIGEIPVGWTVHGLDKIARFLNGLALQKYPPKDGRSLPVIKIAQLRLGSTEGADAASADLAPEYIVEDGDVLFSWSGSLECILWAGGRGALNQHLFKVTSDEFPKWLYYLWVHQHLEDFRHIAAGKATTMGHIQRHHLSAAKVVLPPSRLLQKLDLQIAPLVDGFWRRNVQSRTLAALRDTLLPKLISGELRVKDAERFIGREV
jgi:type I restriction enzyme, S subunit